MQTVQTLKKHNQLTYKYLACKYLEYRNSTSLMGEPKDITISNVQLVNPWGASKIFQAVHR
jgi:hypothetical protein